MASHMTCGPVGSQEGQVALQDSVNLLGDFGGLSSLGFTVLLGEELSEVGEKVCAPWKYSPRLRRPGPGTLMEVSRKLLTEAA